MKYLFEVLFSDGSSIKQTPEDKSLVVEGKNAFYDVLQRLKEVRAFALYNQETGDEYLIDLADCHFEVNGIPFKQHKEAVTNPRLIFFKRNTINVLTHEVYPVQYFLGFQANNEAGENVEHTINVV